jgi:hypothetical protein
MSPVVSLRNYWYDEIKERMTIDAERRTSDRGPGIPVRGEPRS